MATVALGAAFKSLAAIKASAVATGAATGFATGGIAGFAAGAAGAAQASLAASAAAWSAVGTIAGAYIDSAFIMPRLFKQSDTGEAKGIGITGLDEGDPHIHAMGPYNRVPGFLYWAPVRPRFVEGEEGGKGGGSAKGGSPDKYYTDGVFVLTRTGIDTNTPNPTRYPASQDLRLVWMDGKVRQLGGSLLKSNSNDYEIYESIENRGGKVALVYTIQSKSSVTNLPPGESFTEWSLENKFRPGLETNVTNSATSALLGQPLLDDTVLENPIGGDFEFERPLRLVGSGTLPEGSGGEPEGRQYIQLEWEYWKDDYLFRRSTNQNTNETTYYHNPDFYQGLEVGQPLDPPFNNQISTRFTDGKIDWVYWESGLWNTPLGTTQLPGSGGVVQNRGYLEFASQSGTQLEISQKSAGFDKALVDGLTLRTGEDNSEIGVLVREEGSPSPALTSFSHLVVDNLDLMDFGSRLPNVEVLVEQDPQPLTLGEAIYRICCVHHDLTPDQVDVTQLEGTPERIYGYWFATPYGLDVLQPLIIAYDLSVFEDSGKIVFRRRIDGSVHSIPNGDLSSVSDGRIGPVLEVKEDPDVERVLTTTVKYTDRDNGYGDAEQIFTRPDLETGRLNQIDLTRLMLTAEEARNIAIRATWQGSMYEQTVSFVVGPKWGHVRAGDFVYLTDVLDQDWRIMVTAVERGADGRMSLSGYRDYGLTEILPTLETDDGASPLGQGAFYTPPQMASEVLDIGPLSLDDFDTPGVYLAACAKFYGADFRGASWYAANAAVTDQPYVRQSLPGVNESVIGVLLDPLPAGQLDVVNVLDNPIRLRLFHGELETTVSAQEVYDRRSLIWIDGEVISFQKATLIDDPEFGYENTYEISGEIIRGLYNTEALNVEHAPGSSVVYIDPTRILRAPIDTDKVDNVEHRFYAVQAGAEEPVWDSEVEVPAFGNPGGSATNFGANGRPFPVSNVRTVAVETGSTLSAWSFFRLSPYQVGDQVRTYSSTAGIQVFQCILEHAPISEAPVETYPPDDVVDNFAGNDPNTGLPFGIYWQELPRDRDYLIKWNFRAPVPIPILPNNTEVIRRIGTTFTIDFYKIETDQSLTKVRTETDIVPNEFTYSHQAMTADGVDPNNFYVTVRADRNYMTSPLTSAYLPAYE